jgi:hypothetical protein
VGLASVAGVAEPVEVVEGGLVDLGPGLAVIVLDLERVRTPRVGAQPELVPNTDKNEVNLEHVLPKNADPADWPTFTSDELNDMKLMLGNMVLLRAADNTSLGNGGFPSKRSALAASQLALTKEVGLETDWTPDAIRARQERLADLAVTTWRLGVT